MASTVVKASTLVCAVAALLLAVLTPTSTAVYIGRARVGYYGRVYPVARRSAYWRRGFYGKRRLLQDESSEMMTTEEGGMGEMGSGGQDEMTATEEAGGGSCKTVLELLRERGEFSLLIDAIEDLPEEMKARLRDEDFTFTFFAPTDAAVREFADWLGEDAMQSELVTNGTAALAILSYHIVPDQAVMAAQLQDGMTLPTALGDEFPMKVDTTSPEVKIEGIGSIAKVTEADVQACKGVVHIVDTLLLPVDGDGEFEDDQLKPTSAVTEALAQESEGSE